MFDGRYHQYKHQIHYDVLQYVWVVQARAFHRLYWLHGGDCGLVVWDRAVDDPDSGGRGFITWMTTRRYNVMCGVLCGGTMSCHLVSNTAWRRYARLRVLWRDVDHFATRRDELLWHGTGIPQAPAVNADLEVICDTVISGYYRCVIHNS